MPRILIVGLSAACILLAGCRKRPTAAQESDGPPRFVKVEELSTQGAAYGVTGMVMTHHTKVMVGVGAFGFATGPYGFLNSSVTVTRSSDLAINRGSLACKQATLAMGIGGGVGYIMPEPVTNLVNSFLRAINIREQINSSGGLETEPRIIVDIGRYHPSLQVCKGQGK